jgi:hypothetical protein
MRTLILITPRSWRWRRSLILDTMIQSEARAELRCGSRVARRVRAATQQQQASAVVRDAQAGLKAIGESCIQRM